MKKWVTLAVALFGVSSYASHTTCSSPHLYYSSVRADMGIAPPHGMKTGSLTIVANGEVLVNEDIKAGEFKTPAYELSFVGDREVLKKSGVQVAGAIIYTETAVLKVSETDEEVLRARVVCENTWAMVP